MKCYVSKFCFHTHVCYDINGDMKKHSKGKVFLPISTPVCNSPILWYGQLTLFMWNLNSTLNLHFQLNRSFINIWESPFSIVSNGNWEVKWLCVLPQGHCSLLRTLLSLWGSYQGPPYEASHGARSTSRFWVWWNLSVPVLLFRTILVPCPCLIDETESHLANVYHVPSILHILSLILIELMQNIIILKLLMTDFGFRKNAY
jgi:hypothetical protein